MSRLSVTLIDVGWGDSILVESDDDGGERRFALVDCNDYETERSSFIFVKRFFDRALIDYEASRPNFEWALLTHGHADHARGMKRMLSTFGTRHFWYPKSVASTSFGTLLSYANSSSRVQHHQSIDSTKILDPAINFGSASLKVLWPDHDRVDASNENNNSVVLAVTLGKVTFVLTGDAEAENWPTIAPRLPATVRVFQVPHHGGRDGLFDPADDSTPWLDRLSSATTQPRMALSSHIRPHGHPHPDVVTALTGANLAAFRTDRHSHLTFSTDGTTVDVQYSHI
jgi:beta-lactamase superfamily II metal-dependent hydrolase